MIEFLVDVNLPAKIRLWQDKRFQHVRDINEEWSDTQIWQYARANQMTIVSQDVDFSNRIIASNPPPKVIHFKTGNMRLAEFRQFVLANWQEIEHVSQGHKLVDVYLDKIIGINQ